MKKMIARLLRRMSTELFRLALRLDSRGSWQSIWESFRSAAVKQGIKDEPSDKPAETAQLTVKLTCDASEFHAEMAKVRESLKRTTPKLKAFAELGVKAKANLASKKSVRPPKPPADRRMK